MIFANQVPIRLYVFKCLIVKAQQGKGPNRGILQALWIFAKSHLQL